jgi:hypothetical protein
MGSYRWLDEYIRVLRPKKLQNFGNGTYWEAASSETGNIFEANIKMDLGQGVTVGGE